MARRQITAPPIAMNSRITGPIRGLMARVRQEVGEDGGELVKFFAAIYKGEIKGAGVKDRMEAGRWLADRGFGKPTETSINVDATAATALAEMPDGDLGVFVRKFLKGRIEALPPDPEPLAVDPAVEGATVEAIPSDPLPDPE